MRWVAVGVEPVAVLAIGSNATGVIAIGQLATGVVAVGQLARGGLVFGQLALGLATIGQLSIGVVWAAGMIGAAARPAFGVIARARPVVIALIAVLWWFAAGHWVVDALTREDGIVFEAPPPRCVDEPGRAC
ncbi:MAG TPA: hypothetical protein VM262_06625 [Acidimicrobiales bacterium]|nr:hypothetical protein [Acidimicrobiales bacterium]